MNHGPQLYQRCAASTVRTEKQGGSLRRSVGLAVQDCVYFRFVSPES